MFVVLFLVLVLFPILLLFFFTPLPPEVRNRSFMLAVFFGAQKMILGGLLETTLVAVQELTELISRLQLIL